LGCKYFECLPAVRARIALRDEWGEIFVVMVELGFFCRTGDRYQMTIPQAISGLKVEAARFPIPCHPVPLSPTGC
jgi:hypothetical protein